MTARLFQAALLLSVLLMADPAQAQIAVLDQAQDAAGAVPAPAAEVPDVAAEPAPPPPCGTQPLTLARMGWPSAELLAEIHARILTREYGCDARTVPGDLAATGSSMGSSSQPAVAPEMWVTRIADVWNAGIEAQRLRPAAPTYLESQFEAWFVPDYVALAHPDLGSIAALPQLLPQLTAGKPVRFVSCPVDWACALINRKLIDVLGIADMVEVVEPANRFEMDTLIAEAVSRSEPILFYYWQPNAVLAQFGFSAIDMGPYDEDAAKCLARLACTATAPSAFADETVVVALAEWVFADAPAIAAYFQRTSLPFAEMNRLLAQLNEPGASVEGVAERFVAEREDIWRSWVGGP